MTILETIPIIEAPGNYLNLMMYSIVGILTCFALAGLLLASGYEISEEVLAVFSAIGVLIFLISLFLLLLSLK